MPITKYILTYINKNSVMVERKRFSVNMIAEIIINYFVYMIVRILLHSNNKTKIKDIFIYISGLLLIITVAMIVIFANFNG